MRPVCLHNDVSILYTTLHYNLIKDKLVDLIEIIFQRDIACKDRHAFSPLIYGPVRKCVKLSLVF